LLCNWEVSALCVVNTGRIIGCSFCNDSSEPNVNDILDPYFDELIEKEKTCIIFSTR
jgi:hypothetical protein